MAGIAYLDISRDIADKNHRGSLMSDDKILYLPGDHVAVGLSPRGYPSLAYEPDATFGMAPGVRIGLEFSVSQARGIAKTLLRKADEAEAAARK